MAKPTSNPKSKKKKIIIAIILILILLAGGAVGFILAMPKPGDDNTTISSDLFADVSATYTLEGYEEIDVGTVSFNPGEDVTEYDTLSFPKVNLSLNAPRVTFKYSFTNKDDSSCRVRLVDYAAKLNITLTYVVYDNAGMIVEDVNPANGFIVAAGETWVVEQIIAIYRGDENAYYRSGDANVLYWALEKIG